MYFEQTWPSLRLPIGHGSLSSVPVPGSGLTGLGQADPTEGGECLQPVATAERDALRDEIKGWTSPYAGAHYHENHPDVKAVFTDIVNRLRGLEQRPKLLRCNAEARNRAQIWIRQLEDLRKRAAKKGTGGPAGCQSTTWIHVTEPFQFTVHRGPTYTIRPGSTRPDCFGAGGAQAQKPAGPVESTAPPGFVVVNGVTYPSSAAAAAAAAPTPPGPGATTGTEPGFPMAFPAGLSLEGELFGIPTKYLVLGVGGLLAYKFLFAKGR